MAAPAARRSGDGGAGPDAPAVHAIGLRKTYGDVVALERLDLAVRAGEFFTPLGPSGSGKTTTLRLIGGFERPDSGAIELGGRDVTRDPPYLRDVNTVFQDYALFPHMSVAENVAYGLMIRKVGRRERLARAQEALEMVRLPDVGARKPAQLSGGQRQRVALARAIVNRPRVLLLDEPLGALDLKLRQEMQVELKGIQSAVGITFVYVTHDQEEALTMSDRIAVMHRGRVEQVAPPRGLYETPATAFVASFIGNINLLAGRAAGGNAVECGEARLAASGAAPAGAAVAVALRPERVRLDPSGALDTVLPMTVAHVVYQGETVRYILKSDGGLELQAVELGEVRFATGARVRAGWTAADARMIPAASATSSTPQESTA